MEADETIVAGNSDAGVSQTNDGSALRFYAGTVRIFSAEPNLLKIVSRMSTAKGSDTASSNTLTLPSKGTLFNITGNTSIRHITNTGWPAGSIIILVLNGLITIKHAFSNPPANTAPILLNAGLDFIAQNNSTLSLIYDGTQWLETSRKI